MGKYSKKSQAVLDSVRERGIRGPSLSGEFAFWCPFCGPRGHKEDEHFKGTLRVTGAATVRTGIGEEKETIELSPERGVFHCWRCSVFAVTDVSWIADAADVIPIAVDVVPVHLGPPEGFETLDPTRPEHSAAVQYLTTGRDLNVLDQALAAGVGFCSSGKYAGRVVIPHLEDGEWRGFVARSMFGREPRYLTPRGMQRRHLLWGLEGLDHSHPVWVTEGVFDALPLRPRSVATYGTGITTEQVDLMAEHLTQVVFCLDADAWKKARMLASRLRLRGLTTAWVKLPAGTDPGMLGWNVRKYVVSG